MAENADLQANLDSDPGATVLTESCRGNTYIYNTDTGRFVKGNPEDVTFKKTSEMKSFLQRAPQSKALGGYTAESVDFLNFIELPLEVRLGETRIDDALPVFLRSLVRNSSINDETDLTSNTGWLYYFPENEGVLFETPTDSAPYVCFALKGVGTVGKQKQWQAVFAYEKKQEWQSIFEELGPYKHKGAVYSNTIKPASLYTFIPLISQIAIRYTKMVEGKAGALMSEIRQIENSLGPVRPESLSTLLRQLNNISRKTRLWNLEREVQFSIAAARWIAGFLHEALDQSLSSTLERLAYGMEAQYTRHPDRLRETITEVRQHILDVAVEEKQARDEERENEREKQKDDRLKRETAQQEKDDVRAAREGRLLEQSIRIAEETQKDSRTMRGIAWVTIAFLPATFVTSFFGMNFFSGGTKEAPFDEASGWVWMFFVVAVPISAIVLSTFYFWDKHEKEKDEKRLRDAEEAMTTLQNGIRSAQPTGSNF